MDKNQNSALVLVKEYFPNAIFDIRYATTNNFTKQVIYKSDACYIHKDLIEPLKASERDFQKLGLRLKFWDCFRPVQAQEKLWEVVPDERYVAPPWKGSKHNRGTALDITLTDMDGKELEMPTPFDSFSEKAHIHHMDLPPEALKNRKTLQEIMIKHGFDPFAYEWWHFSWGTDEDYPILDFDL